MAKSKRQSSKSSKKNKNYNQKDDPSNENNNKVADIEKGGAADSNVSESDFTQNNDDGSDERTGLDIGIAPKGMDA